MRMLLVMALLSVTGRSYSQPDHKAAPLAIAHGEGASVAVQPGTFIHKWIGQDGQPYSILNRFSDPLTPTDQRRIENSLTTAVQRLEEEQNRLKAMTKEMQKLEIH